MVPEFATEHDVIAAAQRLREAVAKAVDLGQKYDDARRLADDLELCVCEANKAARQAEDELRETSLRLRTVAIGEVFA